MAGETDNREGPANAPVRVLSTGETVEAAHNRLNASAQFEPAEVHPTSTILVNSPANAADRPREVDDSE
jgi:hypothetical protein